MKTFLSLFKVELKQIFNFKSIKKLSKTDLKSILKVVGFIVVICIIIIYVGFYAWALAESGLSEVLLSLGFVLGSLLIFFTTIYKASGILFKSNDYDLLMSMPLSTMKIVSAKLSSLYISELGFISILMIPIYLIYVNHVGFEWITLLMFVLSFAFIPIIPLIAGVFLGFICTYIASKFKQSNLMNVFLSFAAIIIFYSFIYGQDPSSNESIDGLLRMNDYMLNMFNQYYPMTRLYYEAVNEYSLISLLLYMGISVGLSCAFIYLISTQYRKLNVIARTSSTKNNYQMTKLKGNSIVKALYIKEIKKYFASSTYVMNTLIGCVVALFFAVSIGFFNLPMIDILLEINVGKDLICLLMIFLVSSFLMLCCTTCTSISSEAPQLWLLKSLPLKTMDIFKAKLALNYTLIIPVSLISSGCIIYGAEFELIQSIFMVLLPFILCVFQPLWGLYFNVKFPKYDWTSEIKLYKQSLSVFITQIGSMFLLMALGALCSYLYMVKQINLYYLLSIFMIIMVFISLVIYRLLSKESIKNDE